MANNAPIGIFDSGIGGLTVVKEVVSFMPAEDIIYFGDTARVPYGPRPAAEITLFMNEILRFFAANQVKIAIVACNTMTTVALNAVRKDYSFPMVGVNFGVQSAVAATRNNRIGVIATQATVSSGMHAKAFKLQAPQVSVYSQACPKFVPLIEKGELSGPNIEQAAQEHLLPLKEAGVDTLILGCTHYPFIEEVIRGVMGPEVVLVNPARETAFDAQQLLAETKQFSDKKEGKIRLCFSGGMGQAIHMASHVIDKRMPEFEQINLRDFKC